MTRSIRFASRWFVLSLLLFAASSVASAAVVVTTQYQSVGGLNPTGSPIPLSSTDLLGTSVESYSISAASETNLTDGLAGDFTYNLSTGGVGLKTSSTTYNTWTFNTTTNSAGYNISEIRLWSGKYDGSAAARTSQRYTISYSTWDAPATWISLPTTYKASVGGLFMTSTHTDDYLRRRVTIS